MNPTARFLLLALVFAPPCFGQVTLDIVLEQEQFLRNESMPVKVRLSNSSGQTLHLGTEPGWLTFEIRDQSGRPVRRLGEVPLAGPFDLDSAKVANLSVDLMPFFDLSQTGSYTLAVAATVRQLNAEFTARPAAFNIVAGTRLWEKEFGVPSTGVPELRKYSLVQATFLKQLRLYVRLTDPPEQKVFRVLPLGPLVTFSTPETQLDASSQLHVLFQTGARTFFYGVVSTDGELIIRQTHEYAGTRPVLRSTDDGLVYVSGGRRRVTLHDLPPPPEPPEPPPTLEPLATNVPPPAAPAPKKPKAGK